jgi:uncharacterized protein (TIGR02452 family)
MTSRQGRAQIARETLEILETGSYSSPQGRVVEISSALANAVKGSRLYAPQQFPGVFAARDERLAAGSVSKPIRFEVVNGTTFAAARRLVVEQHREDVLCLNFASAKHPGGGFLTGAQAQEECLARASGLYACLAPLRTMYDTNKRYRSSLYTDHLIYSPQVPVFRDDDDRLQESAWRVSVLTAPAVNAGAVLDNEPENIPRIQETMLRRMEKLLSIAVVHGHAALVLGAWGCGVFRNDPASVARWFHYHLFENDTFRNAFDTVVFAVLDHGPELANLKPFQDMFA